VAYGARLESVLGASPQGFESLILRALRKKTFTNETVKKPQSNLGLLSFCSFSLEGMRERNPMPDEILQLMVSENVLQDYLARPVYQQSDYLGWISRAARPETRLKRVRQMVD